MTNEITVVLVGIGGYGHNYVSALLDAPPAQEAKKPGFLEKPGFSAARIVGAVDPSPERCTRLADVQARGIPICSSLEQFYASARADLAVISTPIHLHGPQTCLALSHGSHVLCEKPLGATVEQAGEMIRARDRAGKVAAIGYQWSFAPTILALKADAMAGKLGRPRRLKTLVLAPRDEKYYGRSRWAGAKQDASGLWVLDSPVNNAAAHSVHNMFFVMGERVDRSAWPVRVTAELYRAHPIQNYDTAMLRAQADNGAEVFFAVSHAVQQARGPVFSYEFEHGVVQYGEETSRRVVARFKDGSVKDYGSPDAERIRKLWATMD
ncbi:MAG: Gfo/Idh/MocA family oxidoreductase, partial [Planctomycetes bacterium]|nr:Gfo/Idh/MocA family oxidoreductase [Planctomycetota bacterium]